MYEIVLVHLVLSSSENYFKQFYGYFDIFILKHNKVDDF